MPIDDVYGNLQVQPQGSGQVSWMGHHDVSRLQHFLTQASIIEHCILHRQVSQSAGSMCFCPALIELEQACMRPMAALPALSWEFLQSLALSFRPSPTPGHSLATLPFANGYLPQTNLLLRMLCTTGTQGHLQRSRQQRDTVYTAQNPQHHFSLTAAS